jgi:hypothetical protein
MHPGCRGIHGVACRRRAASFLLNALDEARRWQRSRAARPGATAPQSMPAIRMRHEGFQTVGAALTRAAHFGRSAPPAWSGRVAPKDGAIVRGTHLAMASPQELPRALEA